MWTSKVKLSTTISLALVHLVRFKVGSINVSNAFLSIRSEIRDRPRHLLKISKNSQKMHFQYFLAVFELLLDSLTAIYVELHQCPSHHLILLTQGPIWEIFAKKFWELAILKNELFLSRPFWIFFSKKKKFLLHSHENQPKFIW